MSWPLLGVTVFRYHISRDAVHAPLPWQQSLWAAGFRRQHFFGSDFLMALPGFQEVLVITGGT